MPTSTYNNCNGDVTLTYNKASELNSRQAKNSTTSSQEERVMLTFNTELIDDVDSVRCRKFGKWQN